MERRHCDHLCLELGQLAFRDLRNAHGLDCHVASLSAERSAKRGLEHGAKPEEGGRFVFNYDRASDNVSADTTADVQTC